MSFYQPLKATEIRLLRSGPESQTWELEVVSLDGDPKFAALSYVWGDASMREPITINGNEFSATRNLTTALRYVSQHWMRIFSGRNISDMRLWADGVCINQEDLDERCQQVQLMKRIYSSAEEVLSSLGQENEHTILAMESINLMASEIRLQAPGEKIRLDWMQKHPALCVADVSDKKDDYGLGSNQVWNAIAAFLQLEYWQRVWIFQEVVLARQLTLFCASHSVQWYDMAAWAGYFFKLLAKGSPKKTCPGFLCPSSWHSITMSLTVPWTILAEIMHARTTHRLGVGSTWNTAFYAMERLRASDPRDLVYGLLGVMELNIRPNYEKGMTKGRVYTTVLSLFLDDFVLGDGSLGNHEYEHEHELWFLTLAGCGPVQDGSNPDDALPSWCPDFSRDWNMFTPGRRELGRPATESWLQSADRSSICGSCLHVSGLEVGAVSWVSQPIGDLLWGRWLLDFYSDYRQRRKQNKLGSLTPLASFVRTIKASGDEVPDHQLTEYTLNWLVIGGRLQAGQTDVWKSVKGYLQRVGLDTSTPTSLLQSLHVELFGVVGEISTPMASFESTRGLISSIALSKDSDTVLDIFVNASTTNKRELAELDDGRLAMVNQGARPGDVVGILRGCPAPVILRPEGEQHVFVGTCYIASGSYASQREAVDGRLEEVRRFEIH